MRLVFDIETDGLLPDVSKVHCIVLKDLDTNEIITPKIKKAMQLLGEAELIIGHNIIKYDIPVLQKLYGFYTEAKIFDTIVAARLMYPDIMDRDFRKPEFPKKPDIILRNDFKIGTDLLSIQLLKKISNFY